VDSIHPGEKEKRKTVAKGTNERKITSHRIEGTLRSEHRMIWRPALERCEIAESVLHKGREQRAER